MTQTAQDRVQGVLRGGQGLDAERLHPLAQPSHAGRSEAEGFFLQGGICEDVHDFILGLGVTQTLHTYGLARVTQGALLQGHDLVAVPVLLRDVLHRRVATVARQLGGVDVEFLPGRRVG